MLRRNSKILILAESIEVNDSSGAKGRVSLIKGLNRLGHSVSVFHYSGKSIFLGGNIGVDQIIEPKNTIYFWLSRMQRLIYRFFKYNVSISIEKIFGQSFSFFNDSIAFQRALKKLNPKDFTQVWTLSQGNNYRVHHALLKSPEWQGKWYAYIHDPYPQQLYPRPFNFVPPGYKQKRCFFRNITIKADRVVFPSALLKEWMQSYYSALKEKSIIIPHQIDDTITWSPNDLPENFDANKCNFIMAGNLLDLRDPEPVLKAYIKLLEDYPEAKHNCSLHIVGRVGIYKQAIRASQKQEQSIILSDGHRPFKEVYAIQMCATANIILEAKSEISPFLPGKFAHCVAADKPIILVGPYYSECKRLLGEKHPYSYEFEDVGGIAQSFKDFYIKFLENNKKISLNREDLKQYLTTINLEGL